MDVQQSFKKCMIVVIFGLLILLPAVLQAKDDAQDQIILLNDSAAALEDSNPGLSKELTQLANKKEIAWEASKAAGSDDVSNPITKNDVPQVKIEIKLLKETAIAMQVSYPVMAKSLNQMAKDLNKTIELLE